MKCSDTNSPHLKDRSPERKRQRRWTSFVAPSPLLSNTEKQPLPRMPSVTVPEIRILCIFQSSGCGRLLRDIFTRRQCTRRRPKLNMFKTPLETPFRKILAGRSLFRGHLASLDVWEVLPSRHFLVHPRISHDLLLMIVHPIQNCLRVSWWEQASQAARNFGQQIIFEDAVSLAARACSSKFSLAGTKDAKTELLRNLFLPFSNPLRD